MPKETEGIQLLDYLRVVRKHRKTIVGFFVTTFLVVMLATFSLTPQYQGTTQVIIEKAAPNALATNYRPDDYNPEFYETQFQLIQSHAVALRVVKMLSLEDTYDTYMGQYEHPSLFRLIVTGVGKVVAKVKAVLGVPKTEGPPGELAQLKWTKADLIAEKIRAGIDVEPIPNSRIVAINYLSPNPEFAALVANSIAKAYLEETLEIKMEAIRRTLGWMTQKADEERVKLEASEKKIQDYMRANNLVTLENRVAVLPEQLSQVGADLVHAQTRREEAEALYNKVKNIRKNSGVAETIPAIASDPALRTLQTQILDAEQNIMQLSGKYGKKHPVMIKALGDLAVLKEKKEQEIARSIQSIKNDYELARSTENALRAQMQKSKTEAQRANENFIQYQALNREMETNRQLYDALMAKIKEQSVTGENQPVVNFWVVEKASIADSPAKPKKAINALLGLALGLFGGIGLAFLSEYLDNTVKDPEEAEVALGTPVLGTVSLNSDGKPVGETVLKEPRSVFAESYKALRTALLLSSVGGPPKKVLVTSSISDEGKTTTAVNLALVLAQSEKRVLLIDGGLRTYLAGRNSGEELLGRGPLPNLAVITAGPIPPNPSELLSSERMKALLDVLGGQFDIIICDSPPILSVTDSRLLSRLFDGTILVTRGAKTTYEMARRSLKLLRGVNAHVLGIVINALDLKKHDYYYHQYYAAYQEEEKAAVVSERLERVAGGKG
jgi:polysaccharide biosynthesis transport protein